MSFRRHVLGNEGGFIDGHISLLGKCYVHGLVCGEGLEGRGIGDFTIP